MGYQLSRMLYRNSLDQGVTVRIVCSALWHIYNVIVYITSVLLIHNHIGKKLLLASVFVILKLM